MHLEPPSCTSRASYKAKLLLFWPVQVCQAYRQVLCVPRLHQPAHTEPIDLRVCSVGTTACSLRRGSAGRHRFLCLRGTRLVQRVGEDGKGVPRCPYGKQCQVLSATRPGRPVIALSFAAELDSRVRNRICRGQVGWEEENHKNEDCSLGVRGPV